MTLPDEAKPRSQEPEAHGASSAPLILTATMNEVAQALFNHQRTQFFPKDRNFLDAHITLFHKLPGHDVSSIGLFISSLTHTHFIQAKTSGIRFLGRGVAYEIYCPRLHDIRSRLAAEWQRWLTPQDRGKFKPHITVQNKESATAAKALYERLTASFEECPIEITGLHLWRYQNGPWSSVQDYPFEPPAGQG